MNNGRFPIALHILTLLTQAEGEFVTSEYLASSININPVLVRKELGILREAGLVKSKEGKNGGSILAKPAGNIYLSEIYQAIQNKTLLGQQRNLPNPKCPVGQQINQHLETLYQEAENALLATLGNKSLQDFKNQFA